MVAWVWVGWLTGQEYKEILWSDRHVLYLGWGGSFMTVNICENSPSWTYKMWILIKGKFSLNKVDKNWIRYLRSIYRVYNIYVKFPIWIGIIPSPSPSSIFQAAILLLNREVMYKHPTHWKQLWPEAQFPLAEPLKMWL